MLAQKTESEIKNQSERARMECADAAFLVRTPQITNQLRFNRNRSLLATPGPPCPRCYPHCSSPPPIDPAKGSAPVPNRRPVCDVLAEPYLATCHWAFACSGVLIKSFIVLHSRKEPRRSSERHRMKYRGGEKVRQEKRKGSGRRETSPHSFL